LLDEIQHAPKELKGYLASEIQKLLGRQEFLDVLPGYLLPDVASQARLGKLLKILRSIVDV
jgi:hypothetical protein